MKTLYNIFEGILDVDNQTLDDTTDRVFGQMVFKRLSRDGHIDAKYDPKKRIIKSKSITMVAYSRDINEIIISNGTGGSGQSDKDVSLDEWKEWNISLDGDIMISPAAVKAGLKLSDLNLIGKNHCIYMVSYSAQNNGWYEKLLKDFLDVRVDPSTSLRVDHDESLFMNPIVSQFACVRSKFPAFYNRDFNIKNCQAKVLMLNNIEEWLGPLNLISNKFKTYKDRIENDIHYNDSSLRRIKDLLTRFIQDNPKTKIIIAQGNSKKYEYTHMDGSDLKIDIINSKTPWTRV